MDARRGVCHSSPPPVLFLFQCQRSVTVDYISACEVNAWHLELWPKDDPANVISAPYCCGSWRHQGACRLFKNAQDFARIKEAIESRDFWLHVVLTYPTWKSHDPKLLYRQGLYDWAKLRKRLHRRYKKMQYIQVWERTRRGYPHCHMAVTCERLFHDCNSDGILNFWELLRIPAVECGFGKIGWCKPIRNAGLMAGYLAKLEREMTGKGKDYQMPTNAPKGFRRLRASVRLLPPVRTNPDITGFLWFCDESGEIRARADASGEAQKKGRMDAAQS